MAQSYVMVPFKPEVHAELVAVRDRVSELIRYKAGSLGLGSMMQIVLAHFAAAPPDMEWLRERVEQAPKRGRPPRTTPVMKPNEWGTEVPTMPRRQSSRRSHGHEWVSPAANPEIRVCKRCPDSHWPPHRYEFGRPCSNPTGFKWTKEILTSNWHFTAEEVAWADG